MDDACENDVKFTKTGIRGLGFKISVACNCGERLINSSNIINKGFEINRRMVFIMRLLGVGYYGINLFCSLMDIASSFGKTSYYKILENVQIATKAVADICFKKPARKRS